MSIVLAALDTSAAARPVLEAALRLGEMTSTAVEAVHVRDGPMETPEALAERAGVPLRLLTGPVESVLLDVFGSAEVRAAVIGARSTPSGRRPVGSTVRHVLERTLKPVVVVPPEVVAPRPFHRLLLPLEGTELSSRPVLERLWPLLAPEVELIVLHVFTDTTLPTMLDQPGYDMELLGGEFLARHFPHTDTIELRPGPVGKRVAEVSAECGADVVVLSWSQDSTAGRARVVREVLGTSTLPVLLLPVRTPDGDDHDPSSPSKETH